MALRLLRTSSVFALFFIPLFPGSVAAAEQDPATTTLAADHSVADRNRVAFRFGAWHLTSDPIDGGASVIVGSGSSDLFVGAQYARFLTDQWAVIAGVDVLPSTDGVAVGQGGVAVGTRTITAVSVGFQWNPRGEAAARSPVKPYLTAGIGPVIGTGSGVRAGPGGTAVGTGTRATIGGQVGGGVDVLLSQSFSLGGGLGYNWMLAFADPIGERDNYSGVEAHLTFGWLFGGR